MANLKEWMKAATVAEQEALAKAVGSHRLSLHQYAADGKSYKRRIRADLAAKLEAASIVMHDHSQGREGGQLPIMRREELADECGACPYVRRCKE